MATAKRLGGPSETRTALIDAAEWLLVEEGYAALSSRRVAEAAGLKHQLIFYYFRGFEDLLLEVLHRLSARSFAGLEAALAAPRPLHALWAWSRDAASTRFVTDFVALAGHAPAIRHAIADFAARCRAAQAAGLERHFAARGIAPRSPPVALAVLMSLVASGLALEDGLGLALGHDETEALVAQLLLDLDGAPH